MPRFLEGKEVAFDGDIDAFVRDVVSSDDAVREEVAEGIAEDRETQFKWKLHQGELSEEEWLRALRESLEQELPGLEIANGHVSGVW